MPKRARKLKEHHTKKKTKRGARLKSIKILCNGETVREAKLSYPIRRDINPVSTVSKKPIDASKGYRTQHEIKQVSFRISTAIILKEPKIHKLLDKVMSEELTDLTQEVLSKVLEEFKPGKALMNLFNFFIDYFQPEYHQHICSMLRTIKQYKIKLLKREKTKRTDKKLHVLFHQISEYFEKNDQAFTCLFGNNEKIKPLFSQSNWIQMFKLIRFSLSCLEKLTNPVFSQLAQKDYYNQKMENDLKYIATASYQGCSRIDSLSKLLPTCIENQLEVIKLFKSTKEVSSQKVVEEHMDTNKFSKDLLLYKSKHTAKKEQPHTKDECKSNRSNHLDSSNFSPKVNF